MSYSKRQLYALGEPLGNSVTRNKVGGGRIYGGGGAPAPAPAGPTNTTVTNTNIPEYAQPYVENMLNAAQAQIYTPDMTGFNPYVPYSQNPQDYVAGFSPLQQQAQSTAANMKTPGQYGAATGLTGLTAGSSLGLAGQEAMTGANLARASTNPYTTAAYMNPFIQNALAPSQQLLNQQYGMQGAAQQGAATQQGAFGGSRNALMQGLNEQNRMLAQNQLVGNAYQQAFGNAQNQMNQVSQQGLAGQQAAMQGLGQVGTQAGQLANIGGQQLGAEQSIANLQNQYGAQQQNNQQNIINQAVQNYATAQQYPYMQLGQLNAMLRGLPMQQSSTQMYQAAPSTVSQLGGLGIAGLGAAGMYNAATRGGASGGEVSKLAIGGAVPMKMMSDDQLTQVQQNPVSSPMARINAQGLEQMHGYIKGNPQAAQMIQQGVPNPQQMAQAPMDRSGVGSIATPPDMTQMAGGGIIAFADEGQVKEAKPKLDLESILAERLASEKEGKDTVSAMYKPLAESQQADIKQQRAMLMPEMATRFGLGLMNSQGGRGGSLLNKTLQDVGQSGLGAVQGMTSNIKDISAAQKALGAGTIEAAKADQARRDALTQSLIQEHGVETSKKLGLAQVAATRAAGTDAKLAALVNSASSNYATQVKGAFDEMAKLQKNAFTLENNPAELWNEARRQVYETLPQQTRELLQLKQPAPAAPAPGTNPAPGSSPAPAPGTSPIINPAMPATPAAAYRFDPTTGTIIPVKQ
jgi:hypothetical protein